MARTGPMRPSERLRGSSDGSKVERTDMRDALTCWDGGNGMGRGEWGKAAGTAVARVCGQLCGRGRVSHRLGQPAGLHGVQSPNGRRAAAESTEAAPAAAGSIERVSTVLRVQWRALRAGQAAGIAAEEGSGRTSECRRLKHCDGSALGRPRPAGEVVPSKFGPCNSFETLKSRMMDHGSERRKVG